jgi:regulator of RNase E activity RraB
VERIFADRLHDLEGAVRNHDRQLVEKMLEEESHTRRLTMIEHDMLRKKVFAFENQLATEMRREELERERRECDQGLRNVDVCLHDVALERQLIDARNDDNISRRLRQAADIAAVQRIQSDESAAVRRALLYAPPPTIPAIRSLVTERINGRNDVAFEFAQREAALNELAVLHGTSPVKATSAMYGVPLPYESKLDSFGQPRATEHYHDRFRHTNDVMDYLHARHEARPVDVGGSVNPGREQQLIYEIQHLNVAPARRIEAIKHAPVPSARKIDLLHELIAANNK